MWSVLVGRGSCNGNTNNFLKNHHHHYPGTILCNKENKALNSEVCGLYQMCCHIRIGKLNLSLDRGRRIYDWVNYGGRSGAPLLLLSLCVGLPHLNSCCPPGLDPNNTPFNVMTVPGNTCEDKPAKEDTIQVTEQGGQ